MTAFTFHGICDVLFLISSGGAMTALPLHGICDVLFLISWELIRMTFYVTADAVFGEGIGFPMAYAQCY